MCDHVMVAFQSQQTVDIWEVTGIYFLKTFSSPNMAEKKLRSIIVEKNILNHDFVRKKEVCTTYH